MRDRQFSWTRIALAAPLPPQAVHAALQALAGLSGQPRIVLEAEGHRGRIGWCVGTTRGSTRRVIAALQAHLDGLRVIDDVRSTSQPTQAAQLRAPGHRRHPLKRLPSIEPATRSVLTALAQATTDERLRMQIILGPRRRPRSFSDATGARRQDVLQKYAEYRFECTLRIAASETTRERARRLINGVLSALRTLEAPGVQLRLSRASEASVLHGRSPYLWPLELSISELIPLLGWPVAEHADAELPGVPARHPILLPPDRRIDREGLVLGSSATDPERSVALKSPDALRHLHVLGPTGVGKSTLLANLAIQAMERNHGLVVLDPKADLIEDLLARIPQDRLQDVVVLDPTDAAPVGLAAFGRSTDQAELVADSLLGIMHSLYAESWGPRTHDILHACLLTLARRGDATLPMIPLLLTNPGFRRSLTQAAIKNDPLGLGTFWGWYEALSDAEREHVIAPLMNKLRPVLMRPGMRGVLGQREPKFLLRDVFTKRRILLVSVSRGILGPEAARLLGSLVVGLLWQTAQGRAAVAPKHRATVSVFIDEVQEYLRLPGDLGDALAQARGLGVGFVLAHQHLGQLTTSVREAVLTNARSRVAFQLSARDARDLARAGGRLTADDFLALPAFQAYAQLSVRGEAAPWCSLLTSPLPPPTSRPSVVRAASRQTYGQALEDIERELLSQLIGDSAAKDAPLGRTRRRSVDRTEDVSGESS